MAAALADQVALWDPGGYRLVRFLVRRGLGVIYLIAFLVAATQFRPLVGEDGLLPLDQYVERRRFRDEPSLFYLLPATASSGPPRGWAWGCPCSRSRALRRRSARRFRWPSGPSCGFCISRS